MASTVNINDMADVIMQGLTEFAELATDDMKEAVKHASTIVRKRMLLKIPESMQRVGLQRRSGKPPRR